MMAKIPKPGKSFGGCVQYNVLKQDAVILNAVGVRTDQVSHITQDFNMGRKMNPALGQAVGHIALSWSPNDLPKLNDEIMLSVGHEYLEKMKIQDTQLLIVRHHDKEHPHLHIIYNRVDNQGKTIPDNLQRRRSAEVCKELTLMHGFFMAEGKQNVKRQQLKGADRVKYALFDTIKAESQRVKSMDELKVRLAAKGINMLFKYKSGTTAVQGISFSKDGYQFKGSEIDRSLSYGNLMRIIERQVQERQEADARTKNIVAELKQIIKDFDDKQPNSTANEQARGPQQPASINYHQEYTEYGLDISIADDIDDEAIHGRNRRRTKQVRTNTR